MFRVIAIWLGIAGGWMFCEAIAWLLPYEHLADNPWYVFLGSGVADSDGDVRFVRPPHIDWQGRSRGDLAIITDRPDPYASTVRFQTDAEGFRNGREIRAADVVFVGDSFTEAGNVPESATFVQRVGRELDVVVRNLGRSGYSPSEELSVLRQHGLPCQPRFVVWQVSENNDLDDEVEFHNWIARGRPPGPPTTPFPRSEAWKRRSPSQRLFRLLRESTPWPFTGRFRDANGQIHEVLFSSPPARNHSPVGHDGWPLIAAAIAQGAQDIRASDAEPVVLLLPKKIRVLGHSVEFDQVTRRNLAQQWDLLEEQTLAWHLEQLCADLDISFVNATPGLKNRAADGELVYLPFDSHLSAEGHSVVAELIVEAVRGGL